MPVLGCWSGTSGRRRRAGAGVARGARGRLRRWPRVDGDDDARWHEHPSGLDCGGADEIRPVPVRRLDPVGGGEARSPRRAPALGVVRRTVVSVLGADSVWIVVVIVVVIPVAMSVAAVKRPMRALVVFSGVMVRIRRPLRFRRGFERREVHVRSIPARVGMDVEALGGACRPRREDDESRERGAASPPRYPRTHHEGTPFARAGRASQCRRMIGRRLLRHRRADKTPPVPFAMLARALLVVLLLLHALPLAVLAARHCRFCEHAESMQEGVHCPVRKKAAPRCHDHPAPAGDRIRAAGCACGEGSAQAIRRGDPFTPPTEAVVELRVVTVAASLAPIAADVDFSAPPPDPPPRLSIL